MKVLFLSRLSPINAHSGTEIFHWELATQFASRGHRVGVVYGGSEAGEANKAGVEVHAISLSTIPYFRGAEFWMKAANNLSKIISANGYDTVVGFGAGTFFGWLVAQAKLPSKGVRSAYYAIDSMASEYRRSIPGIKLRGPTNILRAKIWYAALRRSDEASCRRSSVVLASSRDTASQLALDYGVEREKISVVHFGISRNFADGRSPSLPSAPMFLHVATIPERKGTIHFLRALHLLSVLQGKKARGVVCGANLIPFYSTIAHRLGLDVEFIEAASRDKMKDLYSECTALISPSLSEGFGLPVIEAFAFGKPVIASSAGSLPELVIDGWNGFLIEPGDEVSLSERMREVIDDPKSWTRMSTNAKSSFANFTIEGVYERLAPILDD